MKHLPRGVLIDTDPTFRVLVAVTRNLREEDRKELSVSRDPDDAAGLAHDCLKSIDLAVARFDMIPVFAFGYVPCPGLNHVQAWAFGTRDSLKVLRGVTRHLHEVMIPALLARGVVSAQAVSHPANCIAHRWLKHLGFSLKATLPGIGTRNEEMLLFTVTAGEYLSATPPQLGRADAGARRGAGHASSHQLQPGNG